MFSHLPLHPNIIFLSLIYFYTHAVSLHFSRISNCILFCDKKSFLNQSKLFDDCLIVLVETEILACVQTPPPNSYIDRMVYHFLTGWFFNETGVAFCR